MRIGMHLNYAGGFAETVTELADYEKAGLDIVSVPEAYSFDAVSQLGFIAARTRAAGDRVRHLPAVLADPDAHRDDRGRAGLRVRRPVHARHRGVRAAGDRGLARRAVRRAGRPDPGADRDLPHGVAPRAAGVRRASYYTIPLPPDQGTGLGKPLKLINHPVRERIPVMVAALGPKNVALAAELAEGWQPIFYYPEKAAAAWAEPLAAGPGQAGPVARPAGRDGGRPAGHRRGRVRLPGPGPAVLRAVHRRHGAAPGQGRNFYYELAVRFGYADAAAKIQDAYLAGRKDEAAGLVPAELLEGTSLIGPESLVAERIAAMREAGVSTLNVTPLAASHAGRVRLIEQVRELAG